MEKPKVKDYYVTKEDGSSEFDEEKYEKDLQSYLDNEKRQASETARKKGEAEGKRQAEEDAKLSAEQKFAKEKEQWEADMKSRITDFNKRQVKKIYEDAGYDASEIEVFLELVTDDEKSSLDKATKLCDARKKYEENYQKKLAEDAQKKQSSQQGNGSSGNENVSFAVRMAQEANKKIELKNNE